MKKMLTYIRTCLAVALLATAFSACKHDNLEVPDDKKTFRMAGDFIRNNYDLTLFAAAIEHTGLQEELNGEGPFTLLAPNNSAWNELGITRVSDFDRLDADSLRNMLYYHVLPRRLTVGEIPSNTLDARYPSLYEGREPFFTFVAYGSAGPAYPINNLFINGAYAVKKDVTLANGILHMIDKVMKYEQGTVQDWLAKSEYTVFVSALKKFGLWEQLAGAGPFTVFAPDNASLEAAGITESWLQTVDTSRYIGARMFGIYLQTTRRLFATDFAAANSLYGESSFKEKIPGDWFIYQASGGKNTYGVSPSYIDVSFIDPPKPGRDWEVGIRGFRGEISGRNDNLTDNGVIHYLPGALVLPEEALKN